MKRWRQLPIYLILLCAVPGAMAKPVPKPPDKAKTQEADAAKASYVTKAEQEVQDLTTKIKTLEDQSKQSGTKARLEVDQHVQSANQKLTTIRQKMQEWRDSLSGAWHTLRQSMEELRAKVKADYQKAMAYFHRNDKDAHKPK